MMPILACILAAWTCFDYAFFSDPSIFTENWRWTWALGGAGWSVVVFEEIKKHI